jgi:ABC-type multidrug transport system fused ATPase/permease subunit
MYILKIINSFIEKKKLLVIIYILFTITAYPLQAIIIPQIYSSFINTLNIKNDLKIFVKYFFIILFFLIIINVSNIITSYIEALFIPEMNEYIINYIYKNLLIKYENNYTDIELGKILARINSIPLYLKQFLADFTKFIFPHAVTIIIINLYFFYINWKLGLISIIILGIFFAFNILFFNRCVILSNDRHILYEEKNQMTEDKLSNLYSIYSHGDLKKEIDIYEIHTKKYTDKYKDSLFCLSTSTNFSNIYNIFLFSVLNGVASYLYLNKKINLHTLIAIIITVIYYTPSIDVMGTVIPDIMHYYGSLKAVDNFIEELYISEKNYNNNLTLPDDNLLTTKIQYAEIKIMNLDFGYGLKKLFNNFSLTIKDGEKVAIVGSSGNGKSTIIKLIMGYYKVPDNTILIDNKCINKYNLSDLRKQISYVNQNNKLFNMSVCENIQYGNELSKEEISEICKRIKIDNIFKNLENGLDSSVGVNGDSLSGGQRQIIHLLRCIGKKNRIIILDEPTAAIDKDNTINVINAVKELGKNNTVILITHDASILSFVDRIITLDSGKIINDKYINEK